MARAECRDAGRPGTRHAGSYREMADKPGPSSHSQDGSAKMMPGPTVSVVLPCFNAVRSVGAALDSLLTQTYTRLEILALDDGSADGTRKILEARAAQDDRIRVLANGTNQGLIRTLNWGVAEARGEL